MTLKFQVLAGTHYEPAKNPEKDGHTHDKYVKDQIIEVPDDRELDKLFPNKFRRQETQQQALTEERKRATQELIDGGTFDEDDRNFLHTLPDENFAHIQRKMAKARAERGEGEEFDKPKKVNLGDDKKDDEEKATHKASDSKPESILGQDVTNKFPRCKEAGLKVFKNPAGKHQVVSSDHPTRAVNPHPLDQKDVNDFVTKYLEEKK